MSGSGSGSGNVVRVVTGIIVQRQTVRVPAGLAIGAPECLENQADCCVSGGAPGCCFPPPPTPLWASRYDAGGSCDCAPLCVRLDYDAGGDDWLSADLSSYCGATAAVYLRLWCVAGAYAFDLIDGAGNVLVAGSIENSPAPSCDPFLLAAFFADSAGSLCPGTYSYVITEVDCTPGSGTSGGGGSGVATGCCPGDPIPARLYAHFSGALAGFGTRPLDWDGSGAWAGPDGGACGTNGLISFTCDEGTGDFNCGGAGPDTLFVAGGPPDSCAPFSWHGSGVASGVCAGAFSVAVSPTP